ncbi:hypothetical protein [Cohnella herbarum]|uniref:Yip1 domain-containing protein n=1 Tax=Cohnella herbarum TaxID=2728023 RepID=A0A7Z2VIS7_9BACL|nr:hypothetical protein [Cohnella herbarum]QJD83983.1 hypothetical protein HH215_12850 [Cohnella herbarum]
MSEQDSSQPELRKAEDREPGELQTAASATEGAQVTPVQAAPPSSSSQNSPLGGVDFQKLLELAKNPSSSLKLQPLTEWIYGAIGAVVGVLGFFIWIWAIQEEIKNELFGGLGNLVFLSLLGFTTPGKYLVIGIFSIALLVGSLTLIGNLLGAKKRSWMEAVTYQGSTQLLFGAGLIVAGLVAFVSLQLSMLLGVILLLINLLLVVTQAEDLHEVGRERRFLFIVYSIAAYMFLLFLVYSVVA